jgi:hypothetical protein
MLISAILGATIFDDYQIFCELLLFILLLYGISRIYLNISHYFLLGVLVIVSVISFFFNNFLQFALNFKLFALCVLTLIYFSKTNYYPQKIIKYLHLFNFLLITHQFITGHFIVASGWFLGQYRTYVNERPIGIFLTPHATSFFLGITVIYLIKNKNKIKQAFFYFILSILTISFTSFVATIIQLFQILFQKLTRRIPILKDNGFFIFFIIIIVPLIFLFYFSTEFIDLLKFSSYTRYYSLEITLGQIFDINYYLDIFRLYFRNYQDYIFHQERTFADVGNELGYIKVLIEGGIVFGVLIIFYLLKKLNNFRLFIIVSLFHYSFVINMPFMLYLMLYYNNQINSNILKNGI